MYGPSTTAGGLKVCYMWPSAPGAIFNSSIVGLIKYFNLSYDCVL